MNGISILSWDAHNYKPTLLFQPIKQPFNFGHIINNTLLSPYLSHYSTPLSLKTFLMAEEETTTKVLEQTTEKQEQDETPKDVSQEKSVIPLSDVNDSDSKPDEKAIIPVPPPPASETKKESSRGSNDRDAELVRLEQDKKLGLIKAWEESEKSKALNKACKKLSAVDVWENSKKATLEAELKKIEEQLEKKKAEYAEKMKNKVADIHKLAEEKRAIVEAQKGEELLKAEESAAKYRATGHIPKKFLGCF